LQAVVQRHELEGLAFAAAVGGPLQPEGAEDRDVAAAVQLLQPMDLLAIG